MSSIKKKKILPRLSQPQCKPMVSCNLI